MAVRIDVPPVERGLWTYTYRPRPERDHTVTLDCYACCRHAAHASAVRWMTKGNQLLHAAGLPPLPLPELDQMKMEGPAE